MAFDLDHRAGPGPACDDLTCEHQDIADPPAAGPATARGDEAVALGQLLETDELEPEASAIADAHGVAFETVRWRLPPLCAAGCGWPPAIVGHRRV